jgi:hypothetical protein
MIDLLEVIKQDFVMPKGGARKGSGRKPKWSKESRDSGLVSCWFPRKHLSILKQAAEALEAGHSIAPVPEGYGVYSDQYVEALDQEVKRLKSAQ